MAYPATEVKTPPQFSGNGKGTALGTILPLRPPDASHVRYRGHVRRVYGVIAARHQRHRHYVLRYKRGHAPEYAHQGAVGPRGQAHITAVIVRADHVQRVEVSVRPTRGRPRLRKRRR
jgi:hypothetical protein